MSAPATAGRHRVRVRRADAEFLDANAQRPVCPHDPVPRPHLGRVLRQRIGELLALRWSDVDLLRRSVTIQRKVIEIAGAGLIEGTTKTKAGRRTVRLPRRVASELEQQRDRYPSTGLVFTSAEGGQVRANNLRRRHWATAVRLAGLDGLTFHDMRHTAVSLWVAAGA